MSEPSACNTKAFDVIEMRRSAVELLASIEDKLSTLVRNDPQSRLVEELRQIVEEIQSALRELD
ncbi:hypothetical protein LZ518_05645 [Sphingomonas sp. RB56-2]|uniref:Histidine kinase n=1 Tax=Sphingomonas brevis TaxID=2908206 RepID=A0ABT0S911_9SPHN|nr:hypothetical protein [Sphingomonas brevis]MCL6740615.1 hypothetical protein [Sphingomonas brevis]